MSTTTISPRLDFYYRRGLDFRGLLDAVCADAPELTEAEAVLRALRLLSSVLEGNAIRLVRIANLLEAADAKVAVVGEDDNMIQLRVSNELAEALEVHDLAWRRGEYEEEEIVTGLEIEHLLP